MHAPGAIAGEVEGDVDEAEAAETLYDLGAQVYGAGDLILVEFDPRDIIMEPHPDLMKAEALQ